MSMRYTLQHLYPGCPFSLGEILTTEDRGHVIWCEGDMSCRGIAESDILTSIESGCNAFRLLVWWQARMPEYLNDIKYLKSDDVVFKCGWKTEGEYHLPCVTNLDLKNGWYFMGGCPYLEPATEQEYLNYLESLK